MSVACKCERCGEFYIPNQGDEACVPNYLNSRTFNAITLNDKNYEKDSLAYVGFSQVDICPKCAQSFVEWWTSSDAMIDRDDE